MGYLCTLALHLHFSHTAGDVAVEVGKGSGVLEGERGGGVRGGKWIWGDWKGEGGVSRAVRRHLSGERVLLGEGGGKLMRLLDYSLEMPRGNRGVEKWRSER